MPRFILLPGLFVIGIAIAHLVQRVSGHYLAESNFGKFLLAFCLAVGGTLLALGYLYEKGDGLWAAFVLGAWANHLMPSFWGTDWQTGSIVLLVLLFTGIVLVDRGRKAIATSDPSLQGGGPGGGGGGGG